MTLVIQEKNIYQWCIYREAFSRNFVHICDIFEFNVVGNTKEIIKHVHIDKHNCNAICTIDDYKILKILIKNKHPNVQMRFKVNITCLHCYNCSMNDVWDGVGNYPNCEPEWK